MQAFRKGREELSQELQEQIWKNEVALELRLSKSSAGKARSAHAGFGGNMREGVTGFLF